MKKKYNLQQLIGISHYAKFANKIDKNFLQNCQKFFYANFSKDCLEKNKIAKI